MGRTYDGIRMFLRRITLAYFKEIQVHGRRNIPDGPVIFAGNHPSGLLDPLNIMYATYGKKRFVSSVAKKSLWDVPVVGFFVKAMKAIPVAKGYDPDLPPEKQLSQEEHKKLNKEMFLTCIDRVVHEDVSIMIFPEGK